MDPLISDRLILRKLAVEDAAHFVRLLGSDSESIQMTARIPDPCTEADARQWIEARMADGGHLFAITRKEDGEFLGAIGLGGYADSFGVGYWVGRPYWGMGYATEALNMILDLARAIGATKVEADTFPQNPASIRVLEKAGFRNTGTAVKETPLRGGLREVCKFELDLENRG